METRANDWVVERVTYGFEIHEVARVTENTAFYIKYGGREGKIRKENIVFSGDMRAAKNLHEKLRSSKATMQDERMKATVRRNKRDEEIIATANSQEKIDG